MNVHDYLIDQEDTDWQSIMQCWSWLLPENFTIWLVTRFADLIFVYEDGSVHLLRSDSGSVEALAESKESFLQKIDIDNNASDWLSIPLVDKCVSSGMILNKGECYAYKIIPLIGGSYDINNIYKANIVAYLKYLSDISHQLKNVPNGTKINIEFDKA
jgi:hypothetical protein